MNPNDPIPTPTTGPAMTELDDVLTKTVTRLLELQGQRQDIEAEEVRLKAEVRTRLNVGDRGTVNGQPVVAVSPNRRFSVKLAAQVLPEPLQALCMVTKLDSGEAKKNLPPAVYETCMAEVGEPIVKLL